MVSFSPLDFIFSFYAISVYANGFARVPGNCTSGGFGTTLTRSTRVRWLAKETTLGKQQPLVPSMMETQSMSMEEVPDGKSDKQKAPKKAPSNAIAWVCEIEGCDKKFAREADLRRHQRTAKVHVVPESKS